jgi:hypothetical protein
MTANTSLVLIAAGLAGCAVVAGIVTLIVVGMVTTRQRKSPGKEG